MLTLGLEPGPKFEKILHQIFLLQLDGKIKNHPQLLKEFRSLAGLKEPPKPPEPKPEPKPVHKPPEKPKPAPAPIKNIKAQFNASAKKKPAPLPKKKTQRKR